MGKECSYLCPKQQYDADNTSKGQAYAANKTQSPLREDRGSGSRQVCFPRLSSLVIEVPLRILQTPSEVTTVGDAISLQACGAKRVSQRRLVFARQDRNGQLHKDDRRRSHHIRSKNSLITELRDGN